LRSIHTIRLAGNNFSNLALRAVFLIIFAVAGFLLGRELYFNVLSLHFASDALQYVLLVGAPVVGAVIGVLVAPLAHSFFEDELNLVEGALERRAPAEIAGGAVGLIAGLGIALLIKSILFEFLSITGPAGSEVAVVLYLIVAFFFAYLGARVGAKTRLVPVPRATPPRSANPKVVDTSVIIDGRITEIVESGFLEGTLVVPRFVLRELQTIADSVDPLKRARGRRGLEVLTRLQEMRAIEIGERDFDGLPPGSVDAKLVRLAKEMNAKLLTNDYNLNRVAHVESVDVLNVNELANALKPIVIPGEEMHVTVVREGKEPGQGVGYLDDGTMIVVESGRRLIGESTDVVVTSVLQTAAGRLIFARPRGNAR
jgi:uncharacterized protein YacL